MPHTIERLLDVRTQHQSVLNAASRLITGVRLCDHITPVLQQLLWLPVRRRVDYKVACLVHQSLSGHAPRYLTDDIDLVADSGRRLGLLRSAYDRTFAVHRTYTSFHGSSFSVAGPRVWNVLPSSLRQDISYGQFKPQLKTFLFRS